MFGSVIHAVERCQVIPAVHVDTEILNAAMYVKIQIVLSAKRNP